MAAERVFVFIDEYGNTTLNLDNEATPSHFIYASIVIKESDIPQARLLLKDLQKKYNQGSPLKSNRLFKKVDEQTKLQRRLLILNEIKRKLNFVSFILVVDKQKLYGDGLKYKKSFIKYFQKVFHDTINENYEAYSIFMDMTGNDDFKQSLEAYIRKGDTLFGNNTYQLAEDKVEEPLLQIADIIANSIGRCYCINKLDPNAANIIDCLKDRLIIDQFPYEKSLYFGKNVKESAIDKKISEIAVDKAIEYIEKNEGNINTGHVEIVKYLLLIFRTNPFRVVLTGEIVNVIIKQGLNFSSSQLRTVIQDLRDSGLLIASLQGKSGYKIPNSENDMIDFYNRLLNSVVPMLKRVKIANEQLQIKSVNEINLLNPDGNFGLLNKLVDQISL